MKIKLEQHTEYYGHLLDIHDIVFWLYLPDTYTSDIELDVDENDIYPIIYNIKLNDNISLTNIEDVLKLVYTALKIDNLPAKEYLEDMVGGSNYRTIMTKNYYKYINNGLSLA